MAQINIKLSDEQKEAITAIAKEQGISVTQLVIDSILNKEVFYTGKESLDGIEKRVENNTENIEDDIENGEERLEGGKEDFLYKQLYEFMKEQVAQKDIQIDQLHKIIYNKDTLLIESKESSIEKKHWWQFWKTTPAD